MRHASLSQLRPSALELWYVGFAACALILVGNGKLILERAGLIGSAHLIGQQVSTKVISGTALIDTFRFTAGAINLIVWGATGLIIYSGLQSLVQGLRTIEYERDFDTRYIHPQGYTHQAYWRQIIGNALLGFVLMGLLIAAGFIYISIAIPDSFAYVQRFILQPSIPGLINPFLGFDIAFIATAILYLILKLVIRHHRLSKIEE
jgi:hypothetical protein